MKITDLALRKITKVLKQSGFFVSVHIVSWMPGLVFLFVKCYRMVANNLRDATKVDFGCMVLG